MQKLELYIHIPFCVQKCAYCDFLSAPANDAAKAEYVDALKKEIQRYREVASSYQVSSVFVGGGTPSILSCEQMGEIFKMLRQVFTIDRDAEITIEANPGTVTEEKLEGWKQAGINRISFGLQSVNNEELKMLGRIHTYEEFRESYDMARQAGFDNINIDLISAIPGQTVKSWEHTLRTVAELHPEHISAYSLIIEEGTRFYQWYGKGQTDQEKYPPLPDEDAERQMYERTEGILEEYGFHRYEISNYAREGKECRHNLGYWSRVEYLGIGLGASSFYFQYQIPSLYRYDLLYRKNRIRRRSAGRNRSADKGRCHGRIYVSGTSKNAGNLRNPSFEELDFGNTIERNLAET